MYNGYDNREIKKKAKAFFFYLRGNHIINNECLADTFIKQSKFLFKI